MLNNLQIENIAVIERAEVSFGRGLNVLTGETGAGKSIVIDSINAVLGQRMPKDLLRTGANFAQVTALFEDVSDRTAKSLEALGIDAAEGALLVQRRMDGQGRTTCRVNGRVVTASMLKEIGQTLMTIHGQHENQLLLSVERHLALLDLFGGCVPLAEKYRMAFNRMCEIRRELETCDTDEQERARQMDLLRYEIEELEQADIRVGEREELEERRAFFQHAQRIAQGIETARTAISGGEDTTGAQSLLESAAEQLEPLVRLNPALQQLSERLREVCYELDDMRTELRELHEQTQFSREEFDEVEERLEQLHRLSRKYGRTEEDMLRFLDGARQELSAIEHNDERRDQLVQMLEDARRQAQTLAHQLTQERTAAAEAFESRVASELSYLDMRGVVLKVSFTPCELCKKGAETAEFLISVNPGEPAKPIVRIASGGELSRIMLAIQNVLADNTGIDTIIFDEVDTGISGRAAQKVGLKLRQAASGSRQVLCVTHSAQIAAAADEQFLIEKHVENGRTFTQVCLLDFEGRKREIARILGGEAITPVALQNAQELMEFAQQSPRA